MRLFGLAALVLTVALAGCGGDEESSPSSSGEGQTIEIRLSDFALDPSQVSVQKPGTYTFRAVNDGQTVHALEIEGHGVEEETEDIQPGETADLTIELTEAGDYELYCPVDDHRGMGMDGSVQVGGAAAGAGSTTTSDDGYGSGG
jgi:plastocyanin